MADDIDRLASVDLLPDCQRANNPWFQIVRDLWAPAPVSEWAAVVTTTRIKRYDRIRPFVTRGVLLVATAILLMFAPGTSWVTWALLLPAVLQVGFEIYLDFQLYTPAMTRLRPLQLMIELTESAHQETVFNPTGILGGLAVPANIVAAVYFTGPGEPTWVKVVALATAAAYGVSAMVSFMTDSAHYSAHQRLHKVFLAIRPQIWLIISVVMIGLIALSIHWNRWSPEMVPLAWALCLVPVVIGMKQRDYERFLRASSEVLPDIQLAAKEALAKDYHNTNTDIRDFNRLVARDESIPAAVRVNAAALAPLISLMSEATDHDKWVSQQERPSLVGIAEKSGSDSSLSLTTDIELDELNTVNYQIARQLITSLLINVGQALVRRGGDPSEYKVTVTGAVRDGTVHVAVRDPLPLIDPWCPTGSTTRWLHEELVNRGGRGLSQHPVDDENPNVGKEIRASWPVKKPPLKLRRAQNRP